MRRLLGSLVLFLLLSFPMVTEAQWMRSITSCVATTVCTQWAPGPYGPVAVGQYPIYCSVMADVYGGAACSWYVVPGHSVHCQGIANGFWQYFQFYCR